MFVTWVGGLTKFVTFGGSGVVFRGDMGMDCFASLAMTVQEKGQARWMTRWMTQALAESVNRYQSFGPLAHIKQALAAMKVISVKQSDQAQAVSAHKPIHLL